MDERIGTFILDKKEYELCLLYSSLNLVLIYNPIFGSIMRFKILEPYEITFYPIKKINNNKNSLTVKENKGWNFVDYLSWIIRCYGGTLKDCKYTTLKDIQDIVISNKI